MWWIHGKSKVAGLNFCPAEEFRHFVNPDSIHTFESFNLLFILCQFNQASHERTAQDNQEGQPVCLEHDSKRRTAKIGH
jgi:hypothetical protein